MIGKRVDSRVGELNRGDDARITWHTLMWLRPSCKPEMESQRIHRRALSMFQQLFELIIPNKPRRDKV